MPKTKLLLNGLLARSAKVGSIFVPAGSLESHLGRYTTNLVVWNRDDTHKISLLGSATTVRFREKYYLLCSRHQLKDVDLQDVCVLFPDGSAAVTSSGSRTFNVGEMTSDSDAYDIAAFDFSEPVAYKPYLKRLFFDFSRVPPDTSSANVVAFILAGSPSVEQKYELADRNHLGTVKRILVGLADGQPADESLLRIKFPETLGFDPDGLSGAPVFVVQIVAGEFRVYLAGMLLRCGQSSAHFLKCGFINSFLMSF